MSRKPLSLSPDLKRLRDEEYDLDIRNGYLLVRDVPYVNSKKEVKRGTLIMKLVLAGDVADKPDNHVAYFDGDHPCHADGTEIAKIKHGSNRKRSPTAWWLDTPSPPSLSRRETIATTTTRFRPTWRCSRGRRGRSTRPSPPGREHPLPPTKMKTQYSTTSTPPPAGLR